MTRFRACVLVASAVWLVAAPAQADDRATAQRLFEEGQALFKSGKTAEACAKFEGAAGLVGSPGVRLNLARCWEKVGRTASAWTRYDEALVVAERIGDTAAATAARQGRDALEPKLSKIAIALSDASVASTIEITRDGEKLPASILGSDVPVDPGDHTVTARAPGFKAWTTKVTVAGEGSTTRVTIPALEPEPAAAPAPTTTTSPAAPAEAPTEAPPSHTLAIVGITTGAVGVVGLGLGTYFGLTASSKWHQADRAGGTCQNAACPGLTQQASNDATFSTVSFIAGGVLAAAGLTLWLVAPKDKSAEHAELRPALGPNMAGLELGGSF